MGSLPPTILLIIVLSIFGLAIFLGVWLFRYIGGREQRKRRANPSMAATDSTAFIRTSPEDAKEILRVSRTKAGALAVFVQGQLYHHLRGISDPNVGQEAIEAINAVQAFAAGALPASPLTPPQAAPRTPTTTTPSVENRVPVRSSRLPATPTPSPEKPDPRRGTPIRQPGHFLDPLTFVEDIDQLVKTKLQRRPNLAERFIHMEAGPDGGIRIYVDRDVFEAVGNVSDPEVRLLIEEAIREWEGGLSGST